MRFEAYANELHSKTIDWLKGRPVCIKLLPDPVLANILRKVIAEKLKVDWANASQDCYEMGRIEKLATNYACTCGYDLDAKEVSDK